MMPIAGILDRSQDNLVVGNGNSMNVTIYPFNAVLNRYGALLLQNDGKVWLLLDAAPSANSRIDVIYVKQYETRSPMSDDVDKPKFGVVKGVASATPVAPSVPAGALELAQVLLPAGVSNTAAPGVVITQTYRGAALKGDMLMVQNFAQRDALTMVADGTLVHNVADGCDYVRKNGKWCGWNMPRTDIHTNANAVTMWASDGVGYVNLLTAPVNLTGWGSTVTVGQVANSAFWPTVKTESYTATRDSYSPTITGIQSDGRVTVGYGGGAGGNRITAAIVPYYIG